MPQSATLLMLLAHQAYQEDQFDDAAKLYEQAWRQFEAEGDWEQALLARYWLADSLRALGHAEEAMSHYSAMIAARADLEGAAWANRIGQCYADLVSCGLTTAQITPDGLEKVLQEGLAWARAHGCHGAQVNLHSIHGLLHSRQGRLEDAIRSQEQALAVRRRHPDSAGYVFSGVANRLADYLIHRDQPGDRERAEKLLKEALDHEDATPHSKRWSSKSLATLARARGKPETARYHLREALHWGQQEQSPGVLNSYEALADLELEEGDLEAAEACCRKAACIMARDWSGIPTETRYDWLITLANLRLKQALAARSDMETGRRLRQALAALSHLRRYARRLDRAFGGERLAQVEAEMQSLREQLERADE